MLQFECIVEDLSMSMKWQDYIEERKVSNRVC
jgi:hypothetical protein